jgi:hypothetical protein
MKKHASFSAQRAVIRILLKAPIGRRELDDELGWTNSCQCVKLLRSRFNIVTTLDSDKRAIYSLPASEKPAAYRFLAESGRPASGE